MKEERPSKWTEGLGSVNDWQSYDSSGKTSLTDRPYAVGHYIVLCLSESQKADRDAASKSWTFFQTLGPNPFTN